jgi:hypothetical protein
MKETILRSRPRGQRARARNAMRGRDASPRNSSSDGPTDRGHDALMIALGGLAVTGLYVFKQELPQLKRYFKMRSM